MGVASGHGYQEVGVASGIIARTARIACSDRQTDTHTHETTTVTFSAHARRGLITVLSSQRFSMS